MARQLIRLDDEHISVDQMKMGCKLDPKLISTFVERWRHETHTFYLPCRECTITLEDVQLQLGLPWMSSYSLSPLNLLIGEPYVTIFWVRFQILFTEVGSIWARYERHFWCFNGHHTRIQ
ncbi:hypothetical protein Goshw_008065 [Gossypium schwendimanii]|uniref:Aminotransferase-like plant mobile domain-containing protein n=1 Tax=Gossypium schwendimanii TaxID=34291 RepID=A0A7J9LW19_GOSSC|nr:hypothetical protein [Gossypium schwendimanii]